MNRERWLQCQWHCTKNLVLKHFYSRFNSISYFYRRGSSTDKLNETKKEKGRQKKKKNRKKHERIQNKNRTTPSTPSIQKSSRFGNAVTRDEYTLSAIYGENCGQGAGDAGRAGAAGWLVAPKIARINIRARHCHSVNFPRCWLYRVRKEERGFARGVAWRTRGWTKGKTQISLPPSHPPRWNFMRSAFSMLPRTCGPPAFSLRSPLHPFWLTPYALLRRYRSASNTDREMHTRICL